jgi:hypothetical protein
VGRLGEVPNRPFPWRITAGRGSAISLATLDIDGHNARVSWEKADVDGDQNPTMEPVASATIA